MRPAAQPHPSAVAADNRVPAATASPARSRIAFTSSRKPHLRPISGDLPRRRDPSLCLFPEKARTIKLATDFVLLDNFYVDAIVSAEGTNGPWAAPPPILSTRPGLQSRPQPRPQIPLSFRGHVSHRRARRRLYLGPRLGRRHLPQLRRICRRRQKSGKSNWSELPASRAD